MLHDAPGAMADAPPRARWPWWWWLAVPVAAVFALGAPILVPLALAAAGLMLLAAPWDVAQWAAEDPWVASGMAAAALTAHLGLAHWYGREVLRQMMAKASSRPPSPGRATAVPAPSDGATLPPEALAFRYHGRDSETLIDTPEEHVLHQLVLDRSGRVFHVATLVALTASWALSAWIWHLHRDNVAMRDTLATMDIAIAMPVVSHALAAALVIAQHRVRLGLDVPAALVSLFIANAGALLVQVELIHGEIPPPEAVRSLLAIPFTTGLLLVFLGMAAAWWLKRDGLSVDLGAPRLLILRVFGLEHNTASLFDMIGSRWPHVGPVVTIVDPSHARFTFRRSAVALALVIAVPLMLAITLMQEVLSAPTAVSVASAYYVAWLSMMTVSNVIALRRGSSRNMEAVEKRLAYQTVSLFRRTHAEIRLVAHDDLWQSTMKRLVSWSDVILMDLRGFTEARQGCQYELTHLVHARSLHRVVFLVDETTDVGLFERTVRGAWTTRPITEVGGGDTTAHTYVARGSGGWSLRDEIRPLLAVVGELATREEARRPSMLPSVEIHASRAAKPVHAALTLSWAGVLGALAAILVLIPAGSDAVYPAGLTFGASLIALHTARQLRELLLQEGRIRPFHAGPVWWTVTVFLVLTLALYGARLEVW